MSWFTYPTVRYPTITLGLIQGQVRFESYDGPNVQERFDLIQVPADGIVHLKNFKPIIRDGLEWGITHIQKKAKFGWLIKGVAASARPDLRNPNSLR